MSTLELPLALPGTNTTPSRDYLENYFHDDQYVRATPAHLWSVLAVCQAVVLFGTVIANLFVFIVFYKKRYLLTPSNRLILNLAISDFAMAVLVMPTVLVSVVTDRWQFGMVWCRVVGLLNTLLVTACIFTLVLISLDRYCAVVSPLHHSRRVTTLRTNWAVAIVWVLSLTISLPPLLGCSSFAYSRNKYSCTVHWPSRNKGGQMYTLFVTVLCFCAPFVLMIWVYITIFHAAKQSQKRVRRQSSVSNTSPSDTDSSGRRPSNGSSSTGKNEARNGRRTSVNSLVSSFSNFRQDDWKAAKTSLLIVCSFTFCWLPYFTIITLESLLANPRDIPSRLESVVVQLAFLGCALNPLVYVFRNATIRCEIAKIIQKRHQSSSLDSVRTGNSSHVSLTNTGHARNTHARFVRRSMSLPIPPSSDSLRYILGTNAPALPEIRSADGSLEKREDVRRLGGKGRRMSEGGVNGGGGGGGSLIGTVTFEKITEIESTWNTTSCSMIDASESETNVLV